MAPPVRGLPGAVLLREAVLVGRQPWLGSALGAQRDLQGRQVGVEVRLVVGLPHGHGAVDVHRLAVIVAAAQQLLAVGLHVEVRRAAQAQDADDQLGGGREVRLDRELEGRRATDAGRGEGPQRLDEVRPLAGELGTPRWPARVLSRAGGRRPEARTTLQELEADRDARELLGRGADDEQGSDRVQVAAERIVEGYRHLVAHALTGGRRGAQRVVGVDHARTRAQRSVELNVGRLGQLDLAAGSQQGEAQRGHDMLQGVGAHSSPFTPRLGKNGRPVIGAWLR